MEFVECECPWSKNRSWPHNSVDLCQMNDVSVEDFERSPQAGYAGVGWCQGYLYNSFRYSHSGSVDYGCEWYV